MSRHDKASKLLEMIGVSVDVDKLIDRIYFSMDGLEQASLNQSKYYLQASRLRAQTLLQLNTLKRKLTQISSERQLKIRDRYGEAKENEVKGRLALDPRVARYQRKFDEATVVDEFAKDLLEVYRQRLMVILTLAKLQVGEMQSELRSAKGEAVLDSVRKQQRKARDAYEAME